MSVRRMIVDRLPDDVRARYRRARLLARHERRRIREAAKARRLPRTRGLLLSYPELPEPLAVLHSVAAYLGYRLTDDPSAEVDAAIRFMDRTRWEPDEALRSIAHRRPVPNLHCSDVSKSRVSTVFAEVFGYELGVDPRAHVGPAVAKSEDNAAHDGRLVICPTTPEPGVSYQRLVDTTFADGRRVEVLRTPVVGGMIPLLYRKVREYELRFSEEYDGARILEPDEVYTAAEQERLIAFAAALRLDIGELDVLRDRADGRIYVVDANPTPWGPPQSLSAPEMDEALRRLAPAYLRVLEHPAVVWGTAARGTAA